jgi:hypothetical protein
VTCEEAMIKEKDRGFAGVDCEHEDDVVGIANLMNYSFISQQSTRSLIICGVPDRGSTKRRLAL